MHSAHIIFLSAALAAAASAGCSSTNTTPAANNDAGEVARPADPVIDPVPDSGTPTAPPAADPNATAPVTPTDGGTANPDAAAALNGCATYVDHTANSTFVLSWDAPLNMDANRCSKVKVGTKVIFLGVPSVFSVKDPIAARGGDTPTPIAGYDGPDSDYTVTFPTAGTFGFGSTTHAPQTGVILVVP